VEKMSTRDVAYFLDCMPETVSNFARKGLLAGEKKGKKGRWRWEFAVKDVQAFKEKYGELDYDDLVNELKYERILDNKEIMKLTSGRMSPENRKKADQLIKGIKEGICQELKKGKCS